MCMYVDTYKKKLRMNSKSNQTETRGEANLQIRTNGKKRDFISSEL